jgi:hypothetical protein
VRGAWLILVVFIKFNFFIWTLVAWAGMGHEWSYQFDWEAYQQQQATIAAQQRANPKTPLAFSAPPLKLASMDWEAIFGWGLFGLAWGGVARMFLLRWRHGHNIGPILACLALTAVWVGVAIRHNEGRGDELGWPIYPAFLSMVAWGFLLIVIGAVLAWPVWTMLVKAFLPKRTGDALLDWQRSLSINVSALARDKHNLVNPTSAS